MLPSDSEVHPDLLEMYKLYRVEESEEPSGPDAEIGFYLSALLRGEYSAVLFKKKEQTVGYALYSVHPRYVYLRSFYIKKSLRSR